MSDVIVEQRPYLVQVEETGNVTVTSASGITVATIGTQGPQGPAGESSQATVATAGETLSALRIVYVNRSTGKVRYADKDTAVHSHSVIGLTTEAVNLDEQVDIQTLGVVTDNSWSWNMSGDTSLYLGTNGALTQTPPTSGFSMKVGFAMSATKIYVRIETPVFL